MPTSRDQIFFPNKLKLRWVENLVPFYGKNSGRSKNIQADHAYLFVAWGPTPPQTQTKCRVFMAQKTLGNSICAVIHDVWKHIWSTENVSLWEEQSSLKSNLNKSVAKKYLWFVADVTWNACTIVLYCHRWCSVLILSSYHATLSRHCKFHPLLHFHGFHGASPLGNWRWPMPHRSCEGKAMHSFALSIVMMLQFFWTSRVCWDHKSSLM